ncbi:MAG: NUDIX hydrolase [Balneolaceae bacterium]|nr:NUDIX hydrolase [Balneolaceae bacterium]
MKNSEIIPVTAAGGVLYKAGSSPKKVLLIKRNGFWDIPKGKLEKGETIEECAVREVEEEVGAEDLTTEKFLCETFHRYQADGKNYGKTTHWYLMEFDNPDYDFEPETNEGITEVKWANIEEAKKIVEFENLVKVLNKVE